MSKRQRIGRDGKPRPATGAPVPRNVTQAERLLGALLVPEAAPLDRLRAAVALRAFLEDTAYPQLVGMARERGERWDDIALVLGVSRQAASKRFGSFARRWRSRPAA